MIVFNDSVRIGGRIGVFRFNFRTDLMFDTVFYNEFDDRRCCIAI